MALLLFTMPNCGRCLISKHKLEKRNLEFTEIDVTKSQDNIELAKKYNVKVGGIIIDTKTGGEFQIDTV
jgi:glutaredoxin